MLTLLEHVRRSDSARCGNKAACLGELLSRGYRVPPSLVLPTVVFDEFLARGDLAAAVARYADEAISASPARLVALEREMAGRCERAELPGHASDQMEAWTRGRPGPFAVRSSGTNEDLHGATFAGQYDSFLSVAASDVPFMVRRCAASLFNARVALYRRRKGLAGIGSMAVLVQDMIPAISAGVVFTQAPRRHGTVLVECAPGLGEGVVSGSVAPNRYYLNRTTLDVEEALEPSIVDLSSIRAAAREALSIEAAFAGPQDVEYGVANDAIYILQARPAGV
jgi:phosphoenolpyruvate synthase/pyruvate phosphate dikinase